MLWFLLDIGVHLPVRDSFNGVENSEKIPSRELRTKSCLVEIIGSQIHLFDLKIQLSAVENDLKRNGVCDVLFDLHQIDTSDVIPSGNPHDFDIFLLSLVNR